MTTVAQAHGLTAEQLEALAHEFEDLMAAIAERRQPEPSFFDGLVTQAVLDAVSRSAVSRSWTTVDRQSEDGGK